MKLLGKGLSSKVYKIQEGDDAFTLKKFEPVMLAKTLYYLLFQSPYPYAANADALKAAYHRRKIAHEITKVAFGDSNVADAYGIDTNDHALRCEYVDGRRPFDDEKSVDVFLNNCEGLLRYCGLPSWQVSRFNPLRKSNVIVDKNSNYRIVDFESSVPFPPWKFDEVDFGRLRKHAENIRDRLSGNEYDGLLSDIGQCELYTRRWKDSELAALRRTRNRFKETFEAAGKKLRVEYGAYISSANRMIRGNIDDCIKRISKEYELDENKIIGLYNLDPVMLHHFSAHLAISLATPSFDPVSIIASGIARCSYTLSLRKRAAVMKDENGKKMHNRKVALFSLLVPKAGAFSYILFNNFTASAILLDQLYHENIGRHLPVLKDLPFFKQIVINRLKK